MRDIAGRRHGGIGRKTFVPCYNSRLLVRGEAPAPVDHSGRPVSIPEGRRHEEGVANMATIEFTAFPRTTEGRAASRRMRRTGKAPGIVYGGPAKPQPIEPIVNTIIAVENTRRAPKRSAVQPLTGRNTASERR